MTAATGPVPPGRAMSTTTGTVTSADGTPIAFTRIGQGPPLVVVDGLLVSQATSPNRKLAPMLAGRFTVYTYDRRGRGGSGDTAPYAVEREIEDLAAVITEAGGAACVYGESSGATLALEAAGRGLAVTRLALWEPPMLIDDSRPPVSDDYLPRLQQLAAVGRRSAAIKLCMTEAMRTPAIATVIAPLIVPVWRKFKPLAHTLPYDAAITDPYLKGKPIPAGCWPQLAAPTLVMAAGKAPAWTRFMRHAMESLAGALPTARYLVLEGQTHQVKPKALAPVLLSFFGEAGTGATPAAGA
jgi:pimeloyl-ACP methyl ester carboxylesterase